MSIDGMRVAFGERQVRSFRCADVEAFHVATTENGVDTLVLGEDSEGARDYHVVTVEAGVAQRTRVRIGVISEAQGVDPMVLLRPLTQHIWLGFNRRLVAIDTTVPLIQNSFEFESTFYQLIPLRSGGIILVVFETGIVALSEGWEILWQRTTDAIESVRILHDRIEVSLSDGEVLSVDGGTGL